MFRKTTVKENNEERVLFNGNNNNEGVLLKEDGWDEYRYKEFVDNLRFKNKFELNEKLAEEIIEKEFKEDKINYHEWMLLLLKKEIDLTLIKSNHFIFSALIMNPEVRFFYYDYLQIFEKESRNQIKGEWIETEDYVEGTFEGHRMIVDYHRQNGYYYYGGAHKEKELSISINSLWIGETFRTVEETQLAAEKYILSQRRL